MEKVMTCYHCGNKTPMNIVAEHKISDSDEIWDNNVIIDVIEYMKHWRMYLCPVCEDITLDQQAWISVDIDINGEPIIDEKFLYPPLGTNERYIPQEVKDAYDSALKVRNLDGAICVLALRRALEKMCKHQGASGKDLFYKLKDLQTKNILPEIMQDISYILRKEGNSAAHGDEVEFDNETVDLMIEFTQIILDYVYTLPEKIKKAQERIKKHEEDLKTEK